jgi:hypothetical protein
VSVLAVTAHPDLVDLVELVDLPRTRIHRPRSGLVLMKVCGRGLVG